ncbi:oxamate carbamoyltransferase subunit AllH family protein, partial [Escherichia coli]
IHRFIHNIIYDIPGHATQAIEKIKHIGSSSGCDMLYGMADGCALSQTYGGNYVS